MKITSKGQVTIPQDIRERFGLLPNTEVEFVPTADGRQLRLVKSAKSSGRGRALVERLRGRGYKQAFDRRTAQDDEKRGLMRDLVDSSVLLDVMTGNARWAAWSEQKLAWHS